MLLNADFGREDGKIRPALHSSGFDPTICSQTERDLVDVKAMGFTFARTHDWALINPNERVCDYFHIFPLMHLAATDPKNYVFGPTDEHSGLKVHFNLLIPDDFDKMAEIFAGTVRHYNYGWADGSKWCIKCWEVWNEPGGHNNMWCPLKLRVTRTTRRPRWIGSRTSSPAIAPSEQFFILARLTSRAT